MGIHSASEPQPEGEPVATSASLTPGVAAADIPALDTSDFAADAAPARNSGVAPAALSTAEALALYPSIEAKIRAGFESGKLDLLFTDIDSTLSAGAGHSADEVEAGRRATREVVKRTVDDNMVLILITGSHFESGTSTTPSVEGRMRDGILPKLGDATSDFYCDALASAGGTKAHGIGADGGIVTDQQYAAMVHAKKFDYDAALAQAIDLRDQLNGLDGNLAEQFSAINFRTVREFDQKKIGGRFIEDRAFFQLEPGDLSHRNVGKLALYFYANSIEERDRIETIFRQTFEGIPVVCCEEKDANTAARRTEAYAASQRDGTPFPLKYCLDLTPVDKGSPIEIFTALIQARVRELAPEYQARGLVEPRLTVWFSGDAGNDLNGAQRPEVNNVIMVGGSSPELTRFAPRLEAEGKRVFVEDPESGRIAADSMLEGMKNLRTH